MPNLRLLRLRKVNLQGDFCYISPNIRWICWQEYPLSYLPRKLGLKNIVALDMQHSKMVKAWKGIQSPEHLKILNLSHSKGLRSTPDFTKVQMLEKLILEGCTTLVKIHPSVGNLGRLQFLNLEDCKEIKTIPDEICNLKLLGYLNLNGCSKLEGLPENLGKIETLRVLSADETSIKQLPSSSGLLKNLMSLSLKGCNKKSAKQFLPHSISGLRSLRRFSLGGCNLFDEVIPVDIGSLHALQELDLAGNNLSKLPKSFKRLTNLESLYLDNWNSPSEEASQIGSFAEAFQKHIARSVGELDKVERWRSALSYTADLRGFSLQDFNGSESSLVGHIVKKVQCELKRLFVANHPVGLESRLEKVCPLLQPESNEIRVIGIGGEKGSGKTVTAKALYNESFQHFDCSCFLADIGTVRQNGLVYLQNQLLYQLGIRENGKVESIAEGIEVIGKNV